MESLYIIVAVLGLVIECSNDINTRNIPKKLSLFGIVIGSILGYGNIENNILILSALSYIFLDIYPELLVNKNIIISYIKEKYNIFTVYMKDIIHSNK